ncbi:helix-turn-helix domain-containing protein [Natrialbaceae archaeon GCM10025810]|uniref:helix-turn-helix domain-containing protein n=1 Tax=Halovalidus salilacus TaxID=3075124 RepID=UPI003606F602
MATLVELDVPADRLGFAHTFDRVPTFEFRIGGMIGDAPPLVWATGPDRETLHETFETDPSVDVIASLTDGTDGQWLFRLSFDDDVKLFQQIVAETDGAILEAHGESGRWSTTLLFHDHEGVSRCHERFARYEFDVEVTRVTANDDLSGGSTRLTETQYETILKAHELGYFDVPRKVTLKELAAELDVSHQALSERLRRCHAALVSAELSNRMGPMRIDP